MTSSPAVVTVITVSYRGDLVLAEELCGSFDEHLDPRIAHMLVVPRADLALFAPLTGPRRRVVAVEDVLPPGYRRLPTPHSVGFGRHRRRIREMWLSPVGVVRGWIVQQIVKLAAPAYVHSPTVVFADSDIVLTAALRLERLVPDGRTRLYRVPGATADSAMHARWHDVAAGLLGLPAAGYSGADYIGNLITWRRDTLLALQGALQQASGRRWDTVVARQHAFSEYILYGLFAAQVLGEQPSGHVFCDDDLVHAGWFYDLATAAGVEQFVAGMREGQVGVAIQSTEGLTLDERRALIDRVVSATR